MLENSDLYLQVLDPSFVSKSLSAPGIAEQEVLKNFLCLQSYNGDKQAPNLRSSLSSEITSFRSENL